VHQGRDHGSEVTEVVNPLRKLITLSSLGGKRDDSVNKRTRSSAAHSSDQEQPASKRPPQNIEPSSGRAAREEATQKEVKKSSQNVRWEKGPLPTSVDHWFYDLRQVGNEPPASLVAASRNMVVKWKKALGERYFPLSEHAGGMVMAVERAHRTFKAVTVNMPISGWTSRACLEKSFEHSRTLRNISNNF
jgi:hypothetical protein